MAGWPPCTLQRADVTQLLVAGLRAPESGRSQVLEGKGDFPGAEKLYAAVLRSTGVPAASQASARQALARQALLWPPKRLLWLFSALLAGCRQPSPAPAHCTSAVCGPAMLSAGPALLHSFAQRGMPAC